VKRRGWWIGVVAGTVAALCLVACDEEEIPARPSPPAVRERVEPAEYEIIEYEDGGSIAGSVRWVGPRPELEPLPVRVDEAVCGERVRPPALRLSARGGVADAVVSLMDIHRGHAIEGPEEPVVIAREACRFRPHVTAVAVGAVVRFVNLDPILHNLHALSGGETVLDFGLPEQGSEREWRAEEPGVLRLVCDAGHGWELGWLHVFAHPFHAVTDEDGDFRISNVPPGRYVMRVWHEGWRIVGTRAGRPRYSNPVILTRMVSVSPRQETTIDFELSQRAGELAGE
jgi:plastocyanin